MTTIDYEKEEKQQAYPNETNHKVEKNDTLLTHYKEKWRAAFQSQSSQKERKKPQPWLKPVVLLAAGIFLMSLSGILSDGMSSKGQRGGSSQQETAANPNLPSYMQIERQLEAKLERTIGQVAGVDHVLVSVTLDSSMAKDYAIDAATVSKTQQERDTGGVQRTITEQTDNRQLVLEKGGATPIVIKESMPTVRGVAVVATGVDNAATREEVFHIVQGLLDVPAHKIIITNGKE